jgi:hypothetical protein
MNAEKITTEISRLLSSKGASYACSKKASSRSDHFTGCRMGSRRIWNSPSETALPVVAVNDEPLLVEDVEKMPQNMRCRYYM